MSKVSVCIPVYNGEKFLGQAIDSVLNQTYKNFELIILDNNSNDNTAKIVLQYTDKRIKYYKNDKTLIITDNWSKILDYANGEYIKYLCADDILSKTCLEKMVGKFEGNPNLGMVFCNHNIIDDKNMLIKTRVFNLKDKILLSGEQSIKDVIVYHNSFSACPTFVMFKKTCIDMNRRFIHLGENNCFASDIEFEVRILKKYDAYILGEVLASNRVHNNQQGNKDKDKTITFLVDDLEYMNYMINIYDIKLNYIDKIRFNCRMINLSLLDIVKKTLGGNFKFLFNSSLVIIREFSILSVLLALSQSFFWKIPKAMFYKIKRSIY